jgi:RNA polymerase sigma factor (sigma-70 family)
MAGLEHWDWPNYRKTLLTRARTLWLDPKLRVRLSASDLVQQTLERALAAGDAYRGGDSHPERIKYLLKILDAVVIDQWREEHAGKRDVDREQRQLKQKLDQSTALFLPGMAVDPGPSPMDEAIANETKLLVYAALQELSEIQRDVFILVRILGLSHKEVAEELGQTPGAISGHFRRGQTRLTEILRAWGTIDHDS